MSDQRILQQPITGRTLIAWGHKSGSWFGAAIAVAEAARADGRGVDAIRTLVAEMAPQPPLALRERGALAPMMNIRAIGEGDAENIANVETHMRDLLRVPTVVAGAVMPDACPSGHAKGTIPVGGVVATDKAIHPGMHSADICCSVAITILADAAPKAVLDAGQAITHFGGGGRPQGKLWQPPPALLDAFEENTFLKGVVQGAIEQFGTQGDGNHFFYVGRLASTGAVALVTHHGSRKPGAMLYKAGMAVAERVRARISPDTATHNAWIPSETRDGETYWAALQLVRDWTKANHFAIHDAVAAHLGLRRVDRFWNEHNFVFRKSDGLFYHAKGATPAFKGFSADDSGLTLIPLNMAEPILVTQGCDAPHALGFAPHGAGRNYSRTAYMKQNAGRTAEELMAAQTAGIDARFFSGKPDVSELPGAYKNAAAMRAQIEEFGLARVADEILPYGCIMAGDWLVDAPWRRRKERRVT